METKKITVECRSCHEEMTIDFATANFATNVQVVNGKKSETRTYIEPCQKCGTMNQVTSDNKQEWGNRKGPNIKLFMFSGLFSCLMVIVISLFAIYFAFKGLGIVFDWLLN